MNGLAKRRAVLVGLCSTAALAGCGPLHRLSAVPRSEEGDVSVLGLKDVRYWGDEVTPQMITLARDSARRERVYWAASGHSRPLPPAHYLAVSGGGDNGAFGSGLLVGWTANGTRPSFKLVTGISTGALIAPFAFLGPRYDPELKAVYTEITPKDVLIRRRIISGLLGDGLASNKPLYHTIGRYFTPELMHAVAQQYERGRLLLIATTDLDAGRPVIWDIGKIAASGRTGALTLIRKILLASAAVPVAFPPVMINVEADGKQYQEMNVDGGAAAQVFVYPSAINLNKLGIERKRTLYVIRNARLDPLWADVERQTLSIAERATSMLIQTQGIGDLYQIYAIAKRDGVGFNLASMPRTFSMKPRYAFDPEYMRALYKVGYDMGKVGYHWAKVPPGYGGGATQPTAKVASETKAAGAAS